MVTIFLEKKNNLHYKFVDVNSTLITLNVTPRLGVIDKKYYKLVVTFFSYSCISNFLCNKTKTSHLHTHFTSKIQHTCQQYTCMPQNVFTFLHMNVSCHAWPFHCQVTSRTCVWVCILFYCHRMFFYVQNIIQNLWNALSKRKDYIKQTKSKQMDCDTVLLNYVSIPIYWVKWKSFLTLESLCVSKI